MDFLKRTKLILGENAIENLKKTRVAIMGLGGVGTYATEVLARSGIENFLLVDFDTVSESNINRQLIALHSNIGKLKTEAMKQRIIDINPNANIQTYNDFCAIESREFLLKNIDFIVDAIDSLNPKVGLIEDAFHKNIKIISVMGAGGKLDPSQIRLDDISKSNVCPLAKRVRKYLRRRGIESGIPVIYSIEKPIPQFNFEEGNEEELASTRGRQRGTLSSISYLPAIMGMWAASYVIRNISSGFEVK